MGFLEGAIIIELLNNDFARLNLRVFVLVIHLIRRSRNSVSMSALVSPRPSSPRCLMPDVRLWGHKCHGNFVSNSSALKVRIQNKGILTGRAVARGPLNSAHDN